MFLSRNKLSSFTQARSSAKDYLLAERILELANLAFSVLVFSQITSDTFRVFALVIGCLIWFSMYGLVMIYLKDKDESNT